MSFLSIFLVYLSRSLRIKTVHQLKMLHEFNGMCHKSYKTSKIIFK
jgi:hypothetical protein